MSGAGIYDSSYKPPVVAPDYVTNLFNQQAQMQAGSQYAAGNYNGAASTLANRGDIAGAEALQQKSAAASAAQMQYVGRATALLQKVYDTHLKAEGPEAATAAVLDGYDHITQDFPGQGFDPAKTAAIRAQIAADPEGTLSLLQNGVQRNLQATPSGDGGSVIWDKDTGATVNTIPGNKYMLAGPGQNIVQLGNGNSTSAPDASSPSSSAPGGSTLAAGGAAPPAAGSPLSGTQFAGLVTRHENGSGANPAATNPLSSATGNGQFIDSTWLGLMKANHPDLTAGKTDQQILAMRSDPNLSAAVVQDYAKTNAQALQGAGVPVDSGTLGLAHGFGGQGAVNLLKADPGTPAASLFPPSVTHANPNLVGKTAGQIVAQFRQAYGATPVDFSGNQPPQTSAQPAQTPQPAPAAPGGARVVYQGQPTTRLLTPSELVQYHALPGSTMKADGSIERASPSNSAPDYDPDTLKAMAYEQVQNGGRANTGRDQATNRLVNDTMNKAVSQGGIRPDSVAPQDWAYIVKNAGISSNARQQAANLLQKQQAVSTTAENTVKNSMSLLDQYLGQLKVPSSITDVNALTLYLKSHTDDATANIILNHINSIQNEYARVITGQTSGAGSSEGARRDAATYINKGLSAGSMRAVMGQMVAEMDGRTNSQVQGLRALLTPPTTLGQASTVPSAPNPMGANPAATKTYTYNPKTGQLE